MILGGDDSPGILAELRGSGKIKIVPTTQNWKDAVINKEIRAAIEIPAASRTTSRTKSPPRC